MIVSKRLASIALLVVLSLLVVACGDSEPTSTTAAPAPTEAPPGTESSPTTETSMATTTTEAPVEPVAFTMVTGSAGASQVITFQAIENINAEFGHQGEFIDLVESELAVEGVATGEFDLGTATTSAVMNVIQQGAPISFIGEEVQNPWVLVSKAGIEGCSDLPGNRLGLHSPGGVSTALYHAWFESNCTPEDEPEILYIAGSGNRVQGLLADELDVTMLLAGDTVDIDAESYPIMANFSVELPEVKTGLYYGNRTFLSEHPEVVTQLLKEIVRLQREAENNPEMLAELNEKYFPDRGTPADVAQLYIDSQLFPTDAGLSSLTVENMERSIEVYEAAEVLEPGADAAAMLDLQYLSEAVEGLGG